MSAQEARAFLRWALAMHLSGMFLVVLAFVGAQRSSDLTVVLAAVLLLPMLGLGSYGKRRWLAPFTREPATLIGKITSGNLPALRAFDQALHEAGQQVGRDGRSLVKCSHLFVIGTTVALVGVDVVLSTIR